MKSTRTNTPPSHSEPEHQAGEDTDTLAQQLELRAGDSCDKGLSLADEPNVHPLRPLHERNHLPRPMHSVGHLQEREREREITRQTDAGSNGSPVLSSAEQRQGRGGRALAYAFASFQAI